MGSPVFMPVLPEAAPKDAAIEYVIDGGGSVITTGSKGLIQVPFGCNITGWYVVADQTGSIEIDVKRATYTAFPTTSSISPANRPTLSSAQKGKFTTLGGWTTALASGDILEFVVNSVSTVTRVTVILTIERI